MVYYLRREKKMLLMKRKNILLGVWLMLAFSFAGCTSMNEALATWTGEHPGISPVAVDIDGDGVPDAYVGDTDGDGILDTEIPGTREAFASAGLIDTMGANATEMILGLFGLGGLGTAILTMWKKYKVVKRGLALQVAFNEVVASVKNGLSSMEPEGKEAFTKALSDKQCTTTEKAVKLARAEL